MATPWPPRATTASSRYGSAAREKLRAVREGRACEGRVREGGSCVKVAAWRVTKGDQGRPRSTLMYVCRRHDRRLARPAAHDRGDSGPGATFPSMRLLLAITFTEHSFFNQRLTVTLCTAETQHNTVELLSRFLPPLYSFAFDQNIQLIVRYNNCNCGHVGSASGAPLY